MIFLRIVCGVWRADAAGAAGGEHAFLANLDDTWDLLLDRDLNASRRYHAYERDPSQRQVGDMALKMMEQSCYSTQYRLKEVAPLIAGYEDAALFRLANAFKLLEQWERELGALHAFTRHRSRTATDKFRIVRHIVYYSHAVRKMIDVTYTVDYVKSLHNRIMVASERDSIRRE